MKIKLRHHVIAKSTIHKFTVCVECPFKPEKEFTFVFRNADNSGDDCALIVQDIYGWDATNQELLVRTFEWDIDEWAEERKTNVESLFEDAKKQLIHVVGSDHKTLVDIDEKAKQIRAKYQ